MAKFDYTSKCAHPKICKRLMTEFLSDASDLTDEIEGDELSFERKRPVTLEKGNFGVRAYVGGSDVLIE